MPESQPTLGRPNQILFVEKPGGMVWLIGVAGLLLFAGLFYGSLPPAKFQDYALMLMSVVFGALSLLFAVFGFRTRNDSETYYGDRVEVYRKGGLLHRLPYTHVRYVAYGVRQGNEHFLTLYGPGKQPRIVLSLIGDGERGDPKALTPAKLFALRDYLYGVVARMMIAQAAGPDGAEWFAHLRLTPQGLLAGDQFIPWAQALIDANDRTGRVVVSYHGQEVARTSMIEDNVVAGLMAIEYLKGVLEPDAVA